MTGPVHFRLFFGVPVEGALREALADVLAPLSSRPSPVRWTRPDQWHATILFLGEVPASNVEALRSAAAETVLRLPPGPLSFDRFGSFRRADGVILWVGVKGDRIEALARAAWEACRAFAPEADEPRCPYHPHVTIGRARWRGGRRRDTGEILTALERLPPPTASQTRTRLVLHRSELTPQGPIHTELGSWTEAG